MQDSTTTAAPVVRPERPPAGSRGRGGIVVGLLAAGVVTYCSSLSGAFVFDDQGAILDNATIRHLWPLHHVLSPPIEGLPVTGRPITNLSFALNHAIHGATVFGYHLTNLGIHLLCALTLFGVVRRTFEQPRLRARFHDHAVSLAAAVALLWMVHPLQTAGVTYISQRAESLASWFILAALYAFIRSTASPFPRRWLIAAIVACWLGIGTKEIAAVIPILIVLYDRTFLRSSWRRVLEGRRLLFSVALAASWLPLAWLIHSTENRGATWASDSGFTVWEYLRIQSQTVVHYLRLVVWPDPLVFDYGRNLPVPEWRDVLLPGAGLLGLLTVTIIGLRRWPAAAFLGVCFFGILAPTSSMLPIADAIFEHRMYLPSAAVLVGLVALAGGRFGPRVWWAAAPLAAGLAVLTFHRNADYDTALSLWQDTVAKRPTNARALGNLANELMRLNRHVEALPHLEAAYRLTPRVPVVSHNLAVTLDFLGRRAGAIRYYREAIALQPGNLLARTNLAHALVEEGELTAGLTEYEAVLRAAPDFADAHRGYARALLRANQFEAAIEHFRRAARLRPEDPEAQFNLGDALARAGRFTEAVAAFRAAVRLRPRYTAALSNLGNALLLTRDVSGAIRSLEEALAIQPDPMIHTNLGLALLLDQRRSEGLRHFEAALRLDPDYAPAQRARNRAAERPPP